MAAQYERVLGRWYPTTTKVVQDESVHDEAALGNLNNTGCSGFTRHRRQREMGYHRRAAVLTIAHDKVMSSH